MDNLKLKKVIKEEYDKCVSCGKCKSVCDMYMYLREEEYSPRGLVQLAGALINGEIKGDSEILKCFYTCFLCLKCSIKCPLEVNIVNLILLTRSLLFEFSDFKNNIKSLPGKRGKILNDILNGNPTTEFLKFYNESLNSGNYKKTSMTLLFPGCFPDKSLLTLVENDKIIFNIEKNLGCCGYLKLAIGDLDDFEKIQTRNLKYFKQNKIQKIITGCPHCFYVLSTWSELDRIEIIFIGTEDLNYCPVNTIASGGIKNKCTGLGGFLDFLNPRAFKLIKKQNNFKPKCNLSKV